MIKFWKAVYYFDMLHMKTLFQIFNMFTILELTSNHNVF
jgi:hypothetical protein